MSSRTMDLETGRKYWRNAAREAFDRAPHESPELTLEELEMVYLAEVDPEYDEPATKAIYDLARRLRHANNPEYDAAILDGRFDPELRHEDMGPMPVPSSRRLQREMVLGCCDVETADWDDLGDD